MSSKENTTRRAYLNGTDLIHGDLEDEGAKDSTAEVAPSISVTTTFRALHPNDAQSQPFDPRKPTRHVYSRYTQNISTRAERVLSKVTDGHAITYSSGLAASYAALVHVRPRRIAISGGYHGCHATIEVYRKTARESFTIIGIDDAFQVGDLCWLETPLNPTGESRDIQFYADKIHAAGGVLLVDSTFAPPPLQFPFKWGADIIMHSGTKYFGGHSDLLCGILVVKTEDEWTKLWSDRTFLGSMMGSLEAWLLLRSLRTLHLRVPRQSSNAATLVQWLYKLSALRKGDSWDGVPGGLIANVWHSSIQAQSATWDISRQLEGGWNATFSILMSDEEGARELPHLLRYFVPATSLGGVESLIEQRIHSDPGADPRLVRVSIGVEDVEDLKGDMRQALNEIYKTRAKL